MRDSRVYACTTMCFLHVSVNVSVLVGRENRRFIERSILSLRRQSGVCNRCTNMAVGTKRSLVSCARAKPEHLSSLYVSKKCLDVISRRKRFMILGFLQLANTFSALWGATLWRGAASGARTCSSTACVARKHEPMKT